VELAQLVVIVVACALMALVFGRVVEERLGVVIASVVVAHTGWHWLLERWDRLSQFRFEWPVVDAAFLAGAMRWMMLLVVGAGLYWLVFGVLRAGKRPGDEITNSPTH